ncbi:uncharacterized protein LOC131003653 [Salvia miltiorrhiza]|uniref:uncharacterized protein LOC131003653 n=1 Tax=Salvia miltiorrhiza TaxID=226208 RepID=UPI0025AB9AFF|nr:uncharacterized protein LOC131003653 [Salvia miltiorrhiza]XP_057786175.1 uncharacterized protein LOC131003653 [Salvia miltiorrhiza]XP_057786176.1 uncharacterized protein LOC131003653 [Salvia miltiorrhiza]XP_057786177.1 uncharacterized protein LOC131003653 [Salvia miltiorrhiza]XP_057786178.1 uncharacterized protein LOC131003653 [Salvia miltiorrhiza]XP_057786179.1 uncharacterized protein LOC131003653 [Salvia miltiorrhiza]XP_057786180.1 uncharacterized protein LOC131003653 [Salvia miltiorrhiz
MACFQSAVFTLRTVYPNAVIWSEENLVAVACGAAVIILNPHNPKVRGVIAVPSSKRFPTGKIDDDGRGADLLNGCLLPYHLSRETRPCARSISWSPAGLASNAGCLLAVCTTGGHVKVYRRPHCSLEWVEVVNISEALYNYYKNTNFGEYQIVPSEGSDVIPRQDTADHKCTYGTFLRKSHKHRRQKAADIVTGDHGNLGEKNTLQIVPVSFYEGKPSEEVTEECLPLISAQQYASRNEMLMSLIVAWSPILETSGNDVGFPSSSSNCCSILAVGGKCGRISLWRVRAPECYSSGNAGHSGEVSLVGLVKAHDSWITAISWVGYGSNVSKAQFALATGSSDGSVKIWLVNGENLLKASEVSNDSLSLLKEVVTVDSSMISVLSLTVPAQSPWKLFLAIGKASGSLELWIVDTSIDKFNNVGCYNAHDRTVAGLAWAFDGRCLYSCSQNNSLKSWVFVGDSLSEVPVPSSSPGLKSSADFAHALDSCFGLAISPGNLAVAVVRRYDVDLLDPMYEGRSHKASVEFLWVGGQQLDPSVITSSEMKKETFPGFPEKELIWWEKNILWCLNQYENLNRLLNILDIVAALRAFKLSSPKYVEHILLKWLASCLGSEFEISCKLLSEALKLLPMLSSRQLHLINIISRQVMLKEFITESMSGKEHVLGLEGLSGDKKEHINLWMDLLLSCENELLLRLVSISTSSILRPPSNSSEEFSGVGVDGLPQMEQWVSQNVKDDYKFLAAEIREVKKRKLEETSNQVHERCYFCSAVVPFESTEYATCSGVISNNGVNQTHKLQRCAVTLRTLPTNPSWYCMCCQRRASKLAPSILFAMPRYPPNFKSFVESSAHTHTSTPCCPFCGILLHRSQPQYFLSPSPV